MGSLSDFLYWFFVVVLGSTLFYHVFLTSITVYLVTGFLLRQVPGLAEVLGPILAGKSGLRAKYFALLEYFLDRFRLIFFTSTGAGFMLRPLKQIYATFLAIALGYTVVLFFIGWATGGSGSIGAVRIIVPEYSVPMRVAIAIGWGGLGYFVWRAVQDHDSLYRRLVSLTGFSRVPIVVNLSLGAVAGSLVFFSQWISRNRSFGIPPDLIPYLQILLALIPFFAIALSKRSLVGFSYVATACYGLALGVPILIGVPLAVAIATTLAGSAPVLVSTTLIPFLMVLYYYALPAAFLESEVSNLVLAGIACFAMFLVVFSISKRTASTPIAILYSIVSFLPFWIPVAFSNNQISNPVGFAIVVFWFVFPMLNGIWDSISWALTYFLLRNLRETLQRIENTQSAAPGLASQLFGSVQRLTVLIAHVGANLFFSALILIVTFFAVVVALQLVNIVIRPFHPEYMVDVKGLLEAVKVDPYTGDGLWIVAMVFATMVPALLHLSVVFFAVLVIATGTGHETDNPWAVVIPGRDKVSYRKFASAINLAALYMALSFFFGSLVLLGLGALYFTYVSDQTVGDLLYAIGNIALRLVGA